MMAGIVGALVQLKNWQSSKDGKSQSGIILSKPLPASRLYHHDFLDGYRPDWDRFGFMEPHHPANTMDNMVLVYWPSNSTERWHLMKDLEFLSMP